MAMDNLDTPETTADWMGISPSTLAKSRVRGDGPPFIKIGHSVRYDRADVKAWLASRKRSSTSQAA